MKNVFYGVMLDILTNLLNKHPERIKKNDKKIAEELNYDGTEFPIHEKDFYKVKKKIYMH